MYDDMTIADAVNIANVLNASLAIHSDEDVRELAIGRWPAKPAAITTCYRFTLVRHPEQFALARDAARETNRQHVDRALDDPQPDRIALQRQRGLRWNAEQ
jgi:hypothetical protein